MRDATIRQLATGIASLAMLALVGCETDPAAGPSTPSGDAYGSGDAGDTVDAPSDTSGTEGEDGTGDAGPTTCSSDEDCPEGEVCAVDRSGDEVRRICRAPNEEGGEVGDSCSEDSDCRSNLCLDGTCTKPCERPVDCKKGWTCDSAEVETESGGSSSINVCQPAPGKECFSDGDCDSGDRCVARRGSDEVTFECGAPNSGGGAVGESCSSDGDCLHNLCVDGECAPPCGSDDHCSGSSGYICQESEIDLGNGKTDSAPVCRPERPCDRSATCKVNETCYVERNRTGSAGVCRQPNSSSKQLGDVCSGDGQCPANLCYDSRFRKICSLACQKNSDCQKPGFRCEERAIADGSGGTRDVDICVPAPPSPCSNPSDCDPDELCSVVVESDGTGLESVCIPKTGGVSVGNSCSDDSDCNSQLCVNGHCSTPCDTRSDCAGNQLCRDNSITKSGETDTFQVCETPTDENCTHSGTCNDAVRVCSELRPNNQNQYEAYCQFPNSNASGQLGDSCSKHIDCNSGLCLGDVTGSPLPSKCSVACRQDRQCGSNQICTSIPSSSNSDVAICTEPCSVTGDCSGSNTCQINENRMTNPYSVDTICEDPPGSKQFGEKCGGGGGACKSGLCLNTYTFKPNDPNDQQCTPGAGNCPSGWGCHQDPNRNDDYYCAEEERRCTKLCQRDGDCSGGVSGHPLDSCGKVQTTLSDGTTTEINACSES